MSGLLDNIKRFIDSYSLERIGHIYFWPNNEKAKFIADTSIALFVLGLVAGKLVAVLFPKMGSQVAYENQFWLIKFCFVFIAIFLLIRIFAVLAKDNEKLSLAALLASMAGLAISLPLVFSAVGIFDGFVWLILFIYVAVGFVVLKPGYIIGTQVSTLVVFILITSQHEKFPYKMRSYLMGDDAYIENLSSYELVFQWILMGGMSLFGMTVLAYLTTVWQRREQDLRIISAKDELTEIMNRRSIVQFLELEILNCSEKEKPLSIGLIDLDFFKNINDTYGHPFGDKALKLVASEVDKIIRRGDAVGRFGGEEFLIVFPDCQSMHARNVINRLREILASKPLLTESGEEVFIDLSAGVAEFGHGHHNHESLIKFADEALYKAKDLGRGRVVLADEVDL